MRHGVGRLIIKSPTDNENNNCIIEGNWENN